MDPSLQAKLCFVFPLLSIHWRFMLDLPRAQRVSLQLCSSTKSFSSPTISMVSLAMMVYHKNTSGGSLLFAVLIQNTGFYAGRFEAARPFRSASKKWGRTANKTLISQAHCTFLPSFFLSLCFKTHYYTRFISCAIATSS